MKRLLLLLLPSLLCGQTILSVQVSNTQALIQFIAPTSPACTVQVSEAAGLSPLVPDTDPAVFTNANTEAAHVVPGSWTASSNTTRTLRIGLRTSSPGLDGFWRSQALAANTLHYAAITCNGTTVTTTFTTGTIKGIVPEGQPTNANAWGQVAYPQWTDFSKPVVEPHTGAKIYSADPSAWSMTQVVAMNSGSYTGGTGWSNLQNLNAYNTAVASTGNANPVNLIFNTNAFNDSNGGDNVGGYWPYSNFNDLGIDVYGSGTDASPANRTIQVGISLDSGQTIYSTATVQLALPQTTSAAAGTVPCVAGSPVSCIAGAVAYPAAYFSGWGKPLPRGLAWTKNGIVTVSSGVVTLVEDVNGEAINAKIASVSAYFDTDWPAGTKIYIAGSNATCTNNYCTLAAPPTDTHHLTIVESTTTLAASYYNSANVAIVVNKTNATGSISVSFQFKMAVGLPQNIWTAACSPNLVTTGDSPPITGFACIFPTVRQGYSTLYFIGTSSPVIRMISTFRNPGICTNSLSTDCPSGGNSIIGLFQPYFDQTDPSKMYVQMNTNDAKTAVFLAHYTGDWSAASAYNQPYGSSNNTPPVTYEMSYTNLTPSAGAMDVRSQILAAPDNTYAENALWGSLAGYNVINTAGISGPYALFYRTAGGGQDVPCFVFAFTAATGVYFKQWRTDTGQSIPDLHFVGCHAITPVDGSTAATGPAFSLADSAYKAYYSGNPLGGPFTGAVVNVYRGGVAGSDTRLQWPPVTYPAAGGYDTTCPSNLPAFAIANGAVGNQCVEVDLQEPCSASPTATEISTNPCPYSSSTKSSLGSLNVGDFLKDATLIPGDPGDNEGFMVAQIVSATPSAATVWLQRNANYSYCAFGKDGVANAFQMTHTNQPWSYLALSNGSCQANNLLIDMVGNNAYPYSQNTFRGHNDVTATGNHLLTILGAANGIYTVQWNRSWQSLFLSPDYSLPGSPLFAGYNTGGGDQSYIKTKLYDAVPPISNFAFDFRHFNGNAGAQLEDPGQPGPAPHGCNLVSGTVSVYLCNVNGTPNVKMQAINVWAGHHQLIDASSPIQGNTISDATPWRYCFPYNAGDCRVGSAQSSSSVYIAGPLDVYTPNQIWSTACWENQANVNTPCIFAGPVEGAQAVQIGISQPDPQGFYQRYLGQLLMTTAAQYAYSETLATPDGKYLLFCAFYEGGYHTGLKMMALPPFPNDSTARNTFVPVVVSGSANAVYIEFGYAEFGSDGVSKFYCTTRADNCRVAGSVINEAMPFTYATDTLATLTPANGYQISVPGLTGHLMYYRVVVGGAAGAVRTILVP